MPFLVLSAFIFIIFFFFFLAFGGWACDPLAYEMVGAAEATFFRAPWRNATYLCPGSGIEDHVGLGCEFSKPVSSRLLDFDADLRVWQLITQLADAL